MIDVLSAAGRPLGQESVRGASSLIILASLLISPVPVWMALSAPIAWYCGLSLASPGECSRRRSRVRSHLSTHVRLRDASLSCASIYRQNVEHQLELDGDPAGIQIARINRRCGQVLDVIAEDDRRDMASDVLRLLETMESLLGAYRKLVLRGLAGAEASKQLQLSLETIEASLDRLWERLNRQAVASLAAMHDLIEFESRLSHLGSPPQRQTGLDT